jgi:hypothetical protein
VVVFVLLFTQRVNTSPQQQPFLGNFETEIVYPTMNMTREYEFVYRNAHPIKRTYQKTVVTGSSAKLPITNDDSEPEMLENEEYYNQVTPALNVLRFLGMIPLEMPSDGKLDVGLLSYLNVNTQSDSYIDFLRNKESKGQPHQSLFSFFRI